MSSPDAAHHSANDLPVPQEPRCHVSIAADPPNIADGRHTPYFGQETKCSLSVASSDRQTSDGNRKSILVQHTPDNLSLHSLHSGNPNYVNYGLQRVEGDKLDIAYGPRKKYSVSGSFHGKVKSQQPESVEQSWWFIFFKRCRQEESGPSWEPPLWHCLCPYPFCPTYRQFARILSLVLIGLLCWGVVYTLLGQTASPGGQLFSLAVLCIAAYIGGWLMSVTTLPPLIGMLLTGLLLQNVGFVHIAGEYRKVVSVLRKIALVIVLTRAGLDLDSAALKRMRITVPKLGLVPWVVECTVIAVMTHYLLGLPWDWAFLLGSLVAAVSPAVVVSCLFRLRDKGYGVAKGIPTLIIAASGIDNAMSVSVFGILHSIIFSSDALVFQIMQGPLSIVGGIGFGILWGILARYVPEKQDPFVVPLRVLMLFGGGLIAVLGSEHIGYGGAGPLGCITAAFVSSFFWTKQGWEIKDNPVATAFDILWMIFDPILFGLAGAQIIFNELDRETVGIGMVCLITGIAIRISSTFLVAVRSNLNLKEKIFVALSWMAKATVQAALAPAALDSVLEGKRPEEERVYAEHVLVICVLSILLTAPVGALVTTLSGPRLLKKTTAPAIVEGFQHSTQPSLRDITITEEDEDGRVVTT